MAAARITFVNKNTGDLLQAVEVNSLKAVANDHATLLDNLATDTTFAANQLGPGSPAGNITAAFAWLIGKVLPQVAQTLIDGNSLDYGQATSNPATKRWAAQLYSQLDATKFGSPLLFAQSGQGIADMLARLPQLLNAVDTASFQQAIFYLGDPVNDIMGGMSLATIKSKYIQYRQAVRDWETTHNNFPIKLIMATPQRHGRAYGSLTNAQYEPLRQQYKADMLATYSTDFGFDYVANYDSRGELLDYTNRVFFDTDNQHNNDAGQLIRALVNKPLFIAAQAGIALAPAADYVAPIGNNPALMSDPNFAGGANGWAGGGPDAVVANNVLTLTGGYAEYHASGYTTGQTYTVTVTVSAYTSGDLAVQVGSAVLTPHLNAAGAFSMTFVAPAAAFSIYIGNGGNGAPTATVSHIAVS